MGIQVRQRCRAVKTRNPSLTGNGATATTLRLQDCKSTSYKPLQKLYLVSFLEQPFEPTYVASEKKIGGKKTIHFPIKINRNVIFSCWGKGNAETRVHMKVGKCYYLDIRKPHSAINRGDEVRTHLVVDVEANREVKELIK